MRETVPGVRIPLSPRIGLRVSSKADSLKLSQRLSQKLEIVHTIDGREIPVKYPVLYDAGGDLSKRWTIDYSVWNQNLNNGKGALQRRQKRIPLKMSERERRMFAQEYMTELRDYLAKGWHIKSDKIDPITQEIENKQNKTVEDALALILLLKKPKLKPNSYKAYRLEAESLTDWVNDNYPDLLLSEFSRSMAIRFLDETQMAGELTNRTRNKKLTLIRTLFNDLLEREYIEENVINGIKKEKEIQAQNYPFRNFEKEKLIPLLQKDEQLWYACQFMYHLFVRPSELLGMKIGQIQWEQRQVMVPNTFKSNKPKYPVISKSFEQVIMDMGILEMNPDWYIFGHDHCPGSLPLNKKSLPSRFNKARFEAKLPNHFTFYCWKHTGNLDSCLEGVNIKALQQQNGHADIKDTDTYLRSLGFEHNEQLRSLQPSLRKFTMNI